jgi:hypothetical protein
MSLRLVTLRNQTGDYQRMFRAQLKHHQCTNPISWHAPSRRYRGPAWWHKGACSHVCLTVLILLIHLSKLSVSAVILFEKWSSVCDDHFNNECWTWSGKSHVTWQDSTTTNVRIRRLWKSKYFGSKIGQFCCSATVSLLWDIPLQESGNKNKEGSEKYDPTFILASARRSLKSRDSRDGRVVQTAVTCWTFALYKRPLPVEHLPCTQHSHCTNIRHLFNIRFVQTAVTCSIFSLCSTLALYKQPSPVQYLPCVQHWHCTNSRHLSNICVIANLR